MDDECEASPKLTAIVENDSNIGTKSFSKASDNSNAKLSGAIPEKNNTLDYDTLNKKSVAKCKTRKRRLSNVNAKEVNDDCNGDYCLTCDEGGDWICYDFCPRAFIVNVLA